MKTTNQPARIREFAAALHYGPGPHPDGSPQSVHGGGANPPPKPKATPGQMALDFDKPAEVAPWTAPVPTDAAGCGLVVDDPARPGWTSYAGIPEQEWDNWAAYSAEINEALAGDLRADGVTSQGEPMTPELVRRFTELGPRIQEAAETHGVDPRHTPTLYRGERYASEAEARTRYKVGAAYSTRNLTSTATRQDIAEDYANSNGMAEPGDTQVLLRFQNPHGIRGIQTAPMGWPSAEVIMPPGLRFSVTRVARRGGRLLVDLRSDERAPGVQWINASIPED